MDDINKVYKKGFILLGFTLSGLFSFIFPAVGVEASLSEGVLIDTSWVLTTKDHTPSNISSLNVAIDYYLTIPNRDLNLLHLKNPVMTPSPIERFRGTKLPSQASIENLGVFINKDGKDQLIGIHSTSVIDFLSIKLNTEIDNILIANALGSQKALKDLGYTIEVSKQSSPPPPPGPPPSLNNKVVKKKIVEVVLKKPTTTTPPEQAKKPEEKKGVNIAEEATKGKKMLKPVNVVKVLGVKATLINPSWALVYSEKKPMDTKVSINKNTIDIDEKEQVLKSPFWMLHLSAPAVEGQMPEINTKLIEKVAKEMLYVTSSAYSSGAKTITIGSSDLNHLTVTDAQTLNVTFKKFLTVAVGNGVYYQLDGKNVLVGFISKIEEKEKEKTAEIAFLSEADTKAINEIIARK